MRGLWGGWGDGSDEPPGCSREVPASAVLYARLQRAMFASLTFPSAQPSFPDGGDPRARAAEELLRAHGLTNEKRSVDGGHAPPQKAPSEPSFRATSATEFGFPSSAGSFAGEEGASSSGQCPLRRMPFFNAVVDAIVSWEPVKLSGYKMKCPAPIVAMRAALARTPPVKALRPKPLIAKFGAVGATSLLVNVPLGAWREHCRKFSPEWFVAVHASIPLVMSLRKAVVMPTFAIIVTITCAVTGQFVGSRLERARLQAARDAAPSGAAGGAGPGPWGRPGSARSSSESSSSSLSLGDLDGVAEDVQRRASTDRGGARGGIGVVVPGRKRRGAAPSMPPGPAPHGLVAGVR